MVEGFYNLMTTAQGKEIIDSGWKAAGIADAVRLGASELPPIDPFAKVISIKNKDFQKIAKVFSVNFVQKVKFAKLKSAKFREFSVSRNFLFAKLSALKVATLVCRYFPTFS